MDLLKSNRRLFASALMVWMAAMPGLAHGDDDCPQLQPVTLTPGSRMVYAVDAGGGNRFEPAFLVDLETADGFAAGLVQWMQLDEDGEPLSTEPHSTRTMIGGLIPVTETMGHQTRRFVYRGDPAAALAELTTGESWVTPVTQIYPAPGQVRTLRIESEFRVRHAGCEPGSLAGRSMTMLIYDVEYDRGDSQGQARRTRARYWVPASLGLAVRNQTQGSGAVAEVVEIR